MCKHDIPLPGIWQHYKGRIYRVIGIASHSETEELMVVYESLSEPRIGQLNVRPLDMFLSIVPYGTQWRDRITHARYELVKPEARFKYIGQIVPLKQGGDGTPVGRLIARPGDEDD